MKLKFFTLLLLIIFPFIVEAQKDIRKECISTTMFSATYSYQFPGADTKILYKNNSTIGASILYKTDRNWLWTANANFIFGEQIRASREEILGIILDNSGELITGDGIWGSYAMFERGWHLQGKVGKIPQMGAFILLNLQNIGAKVQVFWEHSHSGQVQFKVARNFCVDHRTTTLPNICFGPEVPFVFPKCTVIAIGKLPTIQIIYIFHNSLLKW